MSDLSPRPGATYVVVWWNEFARCQYQSARTFATLDGARGYRNRELCNITHDNVQIWQRDGAWERVS